jgi:outer membrane protein OmpA-like peptidoglycan-associated protein
MASPESAPFVEIIRERWMVRVRGRVEDAGTRVAWARLAREAGVGQVVDHVEIGDVAGGAAPQAGPWGAWLPGALASLAEGTVTLHPGRIAVRGRCRDEESALRWMDALREALPEGWELTGEMEAEDIGARARLRVEWKPDHVVCRGVLPGADWEAQRKRWSGDTPRTLPIRDEVVPGAEPGEAWVEEVGAFLRWFEAETKEGVVEIEDGRVELRGVVPDVVAKVRLGREARAVAGPEGRVRNFLGIEPPTREMLPQVAATVPALPAVAMPAPPAEPVPTEVAMAKTEAEPTPGPTPPVPAPVPGVGAKPDAAGPLRVEIGPGGGRVRGAVKGTWVADAVRAAGGAFRDETVPSEGARSESWHGALAACLPPLAEHLARGELSLAQGKAVLRGEAKSAEARERLLVAVARALPEGMQVEDGMTVAAGIGPGVAAVSMEPGAEGTEEGAAGEPEAGFSRDIFFNTGSTYLKPEFREHLREAASALEGAGDGATLLIKGYADARGDRGTNEILSRQRAQAIRDHLVKLGVRPARLELVGVGAAEAGSGAGEYVWKQDRRVEVILVR